MKTRLISAALAFALYTAHATMELPSNGDEAAIERYIKQKDIHDIFFTAAFYRVKTEMNELTEISPDEKGRRAVTVTRTYYGAVDQATHTVDSGTPLQYTETTREWLYPSQIINNTLPSEVQEFPLFLYRSHYNFNTIDKQTGSLESDAVLIRIPRKHQTEWMKHVRKSCGFTSPPPATSPSRNPHGEGKERQAFYAECEKLKQAINKPETWASLLQDARTRELLILFAAQAHNTQALEALLQQGGPAECAPYFHTTPLSYVCGTVMGGECDETEVCCVDAYKEQTKLIALMLKHGANPNTPSGDAGLTPLMLAVRSGSEEAVRLLLEADASPAARDCNGMTSLHWAVAEKQHHLLPILVEAASALNEVPTQINMPVITCYSSGEKYNTSLRTGMSPLHTAAELADDCSIRFLLDNGANPHAIDRFGRKPIDMLPAKAGPELRQMLEEAMQQPVIPLSELRHVRSWAEHADFVFRFKPQMIELANTTFEDVPECGNCTVDLIADVDLHAADGSIRKARFNAWVFDYASKQEQANLEQYKTTLRQRHKNMDEIAIVSHAFTEEDGTLSAHPELRVHLPNHPIIWKTALRYMQKSHRESDEEERLLQMERINNK